MDQPGNVGSHNSLVLDSQDRPHISYIGNSDLKYAAWDGIMWQIEIVEKDGWFRGTSLALDSSEIAHISYFDVRRADLMIAHQQ